MRTLLLLLLLALLIILTLGLDKSLEKYIDFIKSLVKPDATTKSKFLNFLLFLLGVLIISAVFFILFAIGCAILLIPMFVVL